MTAVPARDLSFKSIPGPYPTVDFRMDLPGTRHPEPRNTAAFQALLQNLTTQTEGQDVLFVRRTNDEYRAACQTPDTCP